MRESKTIWPGRKRPVQARRTWLVWFYHAALTAVFLCLQLWAQPAASEPSSWRARMKALADTLGDLLPELVAKQSDPKALEKGAKALAGLSHTLKKQGKGNPIAPPSDRDPSIDLLAGQFAEQTGRAYRAIQNGHLEYGKSLLRTVTDYCIGCHTRHEKGPSFSEFPLSPRAQALGKEEKAELYLATRQFDKALGAFQEILAEPQPGSRAFEHGEALQHALAIAIRVKKDPGAADQCLAAPLNSSALTANERNLLLKWRQAVADWKAESAQRGKGETNAFSEMKRVFEQAQHVQRYPADRSAEIQYLRASAAAHDVLRAETDPKRIAEALKIAGVSYETLASPFWTLHELYFEACVRELPHSPLAQDCYARLEQALIFGYTGSSGTHLPQDVKKLLVQLKSLANPKRVGNTAGKKPSR